MMRKDLLRIFLIFLAFEAMRQVGGNIPAIIRDQPAFTDFTNRNGILLNLSGLIVFLLYPLTAYIVLRKYFNKSKQTVILLLLVSVAAIITLRYSIEEWLFPTFFHFSNYNPQTPIAYYYIDNIYFACLYSAFGIVYFLVQKDKQNQFKETQLQLVNQQTELSFLRSQVNPHFLFNSLNNIYSLVYHESDQSLTAIAKLSDLLRYMLYDTNEKVPLQKELDYINKYIELQEMRFENTSPVHVAITGNTERASIPPLLLIPFVENAFKHGDIKQPQLVKINVSVDDATIHFNISNPIGNHQKDASGGIGLENVRRRLELLYPGRYTLQVQERAAIFDVQLEIRK
jgi:two-component system LytT family sensor kinase